MGPNRRKWCIVTTFADYLGIEYAKRTTEKPRTRGLTMVMDQGWGNEFVEGMLEGFSGSLDVVKLWDPCLASPLEVVRRKVQLYRKYDVVVQPGGLFLEMARNQGAGDQALTRLKEFGFNAVEVSSTTSTRSELDADARFVEKAKKMGFAVFGEVGRKFADGDETRLTEDTVDIDRTVAEFNSLLGAGAEKVYWEGHLLRIVMGDDPDEIHKRAGTGTQQVREVVRQVGLDNIMFEVSGLRPRANRQWLQFWLVRVFGPEVNIANATIEELANLEAIRSGNHPIFGFGSAGNYPWIRARAEGRADDWWRT